MIPDLHHPRILLTALKPLSNHPCPRCLIHHDDLCDAGTPEDAARRAQVRTDTAGLRRDIKRARQLIFKKGAAVAGQRVKKRLESRSVNPIQVRISHLSYIISTLIHDTVGILDTPRPLWCQLLRAFCPRPHARVRARCLEGDIYSSDASASSPGRGYGAGIQPAVHPMHARLIAHWLINLPPNSMRNMPSFGRDKIRKFWSDVTARKQLAARDYEDFLIVSLRARISRGR